MVAATRTIPSTASGASLPYNNALDWQNKVHYEVVALWQFSAMPLTSVAGTANAITGLVHTSLVAAPAGYLLGQKYTFQPVLANTGGVTININGLGAADLANADGGTLSGGDLVVGRMYLIEYDATRFRIISSSALGSAALGATKPDLYLRDEKTAGSHGGTATGGASATRTLNTVVINTLAGASLSANRFTLPAGSYWIEWSAPGHKCGPYTTHLRNITDTTDIDFGTPEKSDAADNTPTLSFGWTALTITAAKQFEIQQRVTSTRATDGFGVATGMTIERYTEVRVWKHGTLANEVDGIPGGGITFPLVYSSATAAADPGSGRIRLNNATQSSATEAYVSLLDANLISITGLLDALDDLGAAATRGHVSLTKYDDPTKKLTFVISGNVSESAYRRMTLTLVGPTGSPFADGDRLIFSFTPAGVTGATGAAVGIKLNFNTATSGDPGSGKFLFNNTTFASATAFHISETDGDANALAALLAAIDNSTSTNKCLVLAIKEGGTAYFAFYITAALSDLGAYDTFAITPVTTSGSISNNDAFRIGFSVVGDKGSVGSFPGLVQAFDSSTADADPGNGEFRLNHATPTSASAAYLDNLDASGATVSGLIDLWDDSTNTVKGTLKIEKIGDAAIAYHWNVTGSVVDGTGYRKLTLANGAGAGTLTAADQFAIIFTRAGDVGSATSSSTFILSGSITPTQLAANTNDWAPTGLSTAAVIRASTDASRNLTGLTGGADGRIIVIHNVGAQNLVLKDEDAGSSAANRFALTADITLSADAVVILQYDSTSTRWRAVGGGGSTGAASDTAAGIIEIAVQSEMETGTDTTRAVVPGRQQYHPSAAKAWVYVSPWSSGGTPTIAASYNVSSLTDTGVGLCTVNFTVAMSSAAFSPQTNTQGSVTNTGKSTAYANLATGSVRVDHYETDVLTDGFSASVVCYGDQ